MRFLLSILSVLLFLSFSPFSVHSSPVSVSVSVSVDAPHTHHRPSHSSYSPASGELDSAYDQLNSASATDDSSFDSSFSARSPSGRSMTQDADANFKSFLQWAQQYKRPYLSKMGELTTKYKTFMENKQYIQGYMKKVEKFNANGGKPSFQLDVNEFADLTSVEFLSSFTSAKLSLFYIGLAAALKGESKAENWLELMQQAGNINWASRFSNYVTMSKSVPVCASSPIAAIVGLMEYQAALIQGSKTIKKLSEQHIWDCPLANAKEAAGKPVAKSSGPTATLNSGCYNHNPLKILDLLKQTAFSPAFADDYPLSGSSRSKICISDAKPSGLVMSDFDFNWRFQHSAVLAALKNGPVGVFLDPVGGLSGYSRGIVNDPNVCAGRGTSSEGGQIMILLGYSVEAEPHWILKNPGWGPNWGEPGSIIRIAAGKNICNMERRPWFTIKTAKV